MQTLNPLVFPKFHMKDKRGMIQPRGEEGKG